MEHIKTLRVKIYWAALELIKFGSKCPLVTLYQDCSKLFDHIKYMAD